MNTKDFIEMYQNAFGNVELPIGFWYSDTPVAEQKKHGRCCIGNLKTARDGGFVCFNVDSVVCPGGKVYAGFTQAPPFLPGFVSGKEHYKETPEMVTEFIENLNVPNQSGNFLNFASIVILEDFEGLEGLIFFATPDILSGLVSWIFFDTNRRDAVSVPFGSGCSTIVAETLIENQNNGHRTFLGLFDPSVRPMVEANILSLAVPLSRFRQLYKTVNKSCLQGTPAWAKVKARINND